MHGWRGDERSGDSGFVGDQEFIGVVFPPAAMRFQLKRLRGQRAPVVVAVRIIPEGNGRIGVVADDVARRLVRNRFASCRTVKGLLSGTSQVWRGGEQVKSTWSKINIFSICRSKVRATCIKFLAGVSLSGAHAASWVDPGPGVLLLAVYALLVLAFSL